MNKSQRNGNVLNSSVFIHSSVKSVCKGHIYRNSIVNGSVMCSCVYINFCLKIWGQYDLINAFERSLLYSRIA